MIGKKTILREITNLRLPNILNPPFELVFFHLDVNKFPNNAFIDKLTSLSSETSFPKIYMGMLLRTFKLSNFFYFFPPLSLIYPCSQILESSSPSERYSQNISFHQRFFKNPLLHTNILLQNELNSYYFLTHFSISHPPIQMSAHVIHLSYFPCVKLPHFFGHRSPCMPRQREMAPLFPRRHPPPNPSPVVVPCQNQVVKIISLFY